MNQENKILGLVICDGVGYRNYIFSHFVKHALSCFKEVIIFSAIPAEVYPEYGNKVMIVELPYYSENRLEWSLRKFKELAHLKNHVKGNFGIQDSLRINRPKGFSPRDLMTRFFLSLTTVFHSEGLIQKVEEVQQQHFLKKHEGKILLQALKKYYVDIVFATHQRPPQMIPLIAAAKKLEIKTVSFIFSWDNISSKGRMAALFDHYLTWSNLMKKDMLEFYPTLQEKNVTVVGTPQFETYTMDEYGMTEKEFREKFDLPFNKKIILYSCSDLSVGPNDLLYISTIAQAMKDGLIQDAVLLVRTSPADDGSRFSHVSQQFPLIRWNYPKWELTNSNHVEVWSQRVPLKEDADDLKAILKYSDVGINITSTMSLDFMLFDKPVVNLAFGNAKNDLYDDQRFYNYRHYVDVIESGAVEVARRKTELIEAINSSLEHPGKNTEDRKTLIDLEVGAPISGTAKRIAEILCDLLNK